MQRAQGARCWPWLVPGGARGCRGGRVGAAHRRARMVLRNLTAVLIFSFGFAWDHGEKGNTGGEISHNVGSVPSVIDANRRTGADRALCL